MKSDDGIYLGFLANKITGLLLKIILSKYYETDQLIVISKNHFWTSRGWVITQNKLPIVEKM